MLSEVLATLELSSRLYFRAELSRPFAVAVPEEAHAIRFHVVSAGACRVALADGAGEELGAGDVVLVPGGRAHVLSDDAGAPATPRPLAAVLREAGFAGRDTLRWGGGGAGATLVCGHFAFDAAAPHPVLTSLPPLVVLRAGDPARHGWVEVLLGHIGAESAAGRPGHREIVRRLAEVLLIEVLRAHATPDAGSALARNAGSALARDAGSTLARDAGSALAALADPQLGRALRAMHAEPDAAWSLDGLARVAGQSRSLFAERFRERVGMPPMAYLAAWRLQKARGLLLRETWPVGEVARRVGYASESAFHRAFRERFGTPPGVFRRTRAAARAASS